MIYTIRINDIEHIFNTDRLDKFLFVIWLFVMSSGFALYGNLYSYNAIIDDECYFSKNYFMQVNYTLNNTIEHLESVTLISGNSTVNDYVFLYDYKQSILISSVLSPVAAPIYLVYYPDTDKCLSWIYRSQNIISMILFSFCCLEYIFLLTIFLLKKIYSRDNQILLEVF